MLFTGHPTSLTTCVLRGSLVVSHRWKGFFARLAPTLRFLHCIGTQFAGEITTALPALTYLGLQRVFLADTMFPFRHANPECLTIQGDHMHANDLNTFLLASLAQKPNIRHLVLRADSLWVLSPSAIVSLQRSTTRTILLDGAIIVDQAGWARLTTAPHLSMAIRVSGWLDVGRPPPHPLLH